MIAEDPAARGTGLAEERQAVTVRADAEGSQPPSLARGVAAENPGEDT